ncbi:hypothetical protein ACIBHX_44035 [Nonomuraea sp. NPDC050536]|uniref:hypothetical protein n=1 Tax=Nonomuraea sp. NPDC050536 TaxID=3364366 RepID=UPI0037C88944
MATSGQNPSKESEAEMPPGYQLNPDPARNLAMTVAHLAARGWRVESQSAHMATLVKSRTPRHVLHALLTAMSCGLWLPVWLIVTLTARERRVTLVVDQLGSVHQI